MSPKEKQDAYYKISQKKNRLNNTKLAKNKSRLNNKNEMHKRKQAEY